MEDFQIIELYFERSESAITETERKYGAYLNQVAYNILRDSSDTEEVVSDTYLGTWNAIPPTRPRVFKHFLSRIARNLSFNRLDYLTAKRRCAHVEQMLSELDDCVPDRRSDTETVWEAKEIGVSLNRFLGTLDHTRCAVFLARYYYAYSHLEISEKYGLTQRQVKYLLSRTRTQLRNHLAKDGVIL